ncbi:AI-BP family protein [Penicillium citrinum]|uniref:NAD(P)H-hydrate epimerase n=1 Tax=Penicillium citrinum TaxID=5077 RepID=A0A9W9PAP6_PENCI|nr:AI-BP family protein [Penicillium citrinum]KAJ5241054.1 AI-BP family protein [Penicillium citrinum]
MSLKAISAKDAASLDKDLMDMGGWSLDQLMELAGLSVSQAGGDGLVAARHLAQYGYKPSIYYPKQGKNELYSRLRTQLENLSIPFITDSDFSVALQETSFLVDAIFGFSFGGPLREPFGTIISQIEASKVPVLSVDAPSSWDIMSGPPKEGPGAGFMPAALISLTAPKPCVKFYSGRHFIGGRFLSPDIAQKYGLDLPKYPGIDQAMEVEVDADARF